MGKMASDSAKALLVNLLSHHLRCLGIEWRGDVNVLGGGEKYAYN